MNSLDTCTSSHPRVAAGLLTALLLGGSGCGLISIDPDEIDVADEEVGVDETQGDEGVDDDADADTAADGTDDNGTDNGTDDEGPGDTGTEDTGDESTTGTDEGTSDASDESDTGDPGCEGSDEVVLGDNPVGVDSPASNFMGSCGGSEGERVYSFTSSAEGDHQFSLVGADFTAVLYLLDDTCAEIAETCSTSGEPVTLTMQNGETVQVVVDSDGGTGTATLVITGP
jgi:hypothetical protein